MWNTVHWNLFSISVSTVTVWERGLTSSGGLCAKLVKGFHKNRKKRTFYWFGKALKRCSDVDDFKIQHPIKPFIYSVVTIKYVSICPHMFFYTYRLNLNCNLFHWQMWLVQDRWHQLTHVPTHVVALLPAAIICLKPHCPDCVTTFNGILLTQFRSLMQVGLH